MLTPDGQARDRAFPNGPAGFAALLAWADGHAGGADIHFGMEATGGYEDALATFLHAAGRVVSVVNPTRIKYAGVMRGRRNKTDKADARLIAAYTRDEAPPAWSPPDPEVRELQALVRRRDDLRQLAAHEKARLDAPLLTPAARQPPRPEVRERQALSRRRDDLRRLAAREKGRLAAPGLSAAARKSITRTVTFLEKEAARLQRQADARIAGDDGLR